LGLTAPLGPAGPGAAPGRGQDRVRAHHASPAGEL